MLRTQCAVLLLSLTGLLSGCYNFGPGRVPDARVGYNEAVARSGNEQMLLNLVRLRYQHVPIFLAVNSVLTQYTYLGGIGVEGRSGSSMGDSLWDVGGSANLLYAERPTITFAPLTGEEFAQQVLSPIPPDRLFSLVQSGWPPEQLLIMGLERINHVENLPFDLSPSPDNVEHVRRFHRVVELIMELARRRAIEMQTEEAAELPERYLVFEASSDAETQALIDEFKSTLGLDPRQSQFRVTKRLTRRKPDEITLRVRSMLALMGFVSRGVEIPGPHLEEHRAIRMASWADEPTRTLLFPLRVYSLEEEPDDAFVSVRYQDHWFYLKRSDHRSKSAFGLLTYLFQLQAPVAPSAGPMLTLPAGG